jgi:hypothetical protein
MKEGVAKLILYVSGSEVPICIVDFAENPIPLLITGAVRAGRTRHLRHQLAEHSEPLLRLFADLLSQNDTNSDLSLLSHLSSVRSLPRLDILKI